LFDQVGKRISLTEAGEELQRYSRQISTLFAGSRAGDCGIERHPGAVA